jgi:cell division protease FtsH
MNPIHNNKSVPSKGKGNNWFKLVRVILGYLVAMVVIAYLVGWFSGGFEDGIFGSSVKEVSISEVVSSIRAGEVESIEVEDNTLFITYKDGSKSKALKESGSIYEVLQNAGIEDVGAIDAKITVKTPPLGGMFGAILSSMLPIIVMILFFLFIFRQAGKGSGGVFDFGKSNAKLWTKDQPKVSFKDAAGVDEAIHELEEVVDFLRRPEKYRKLGARIPKGVLLVGPAGTGKTLLARAVANEAQVPFFSMAGSEFMEMLVGVGASRVRDLFKQAKENAPALIFIDEVESIGRQRGRSMMTSHGEQEQTLNQILVEMDGFTPNDNVIVLAATNRPDLLDAALTRPGRFDRQVALQLPDIKGREEIVRVHVNNKPLASSVKMEEIAKMTVGFSGAEIENMLNEAAILTAASDKTEISMFEVKESITKVKLGRARRHIQSEEDKKITAYHEAGHAIVAKRLPNMDLVNRVSIVSRGLALGFTEINPEGDKSHQTHSDLINRITALLGGRAAEELVYHDRTVGAGNDLEKASTIAYRMVSEFGMSELGPIAFVYKKADEDFNMTSQYSEEMMAQIDQQVKKIIDQCYQGAYNILSQDRLLLDEVARVLLVEETLEQDEFDSIVEKYPRTVNE